MTSLLMFFLFFFEKLVVLVFCGEVYLSIQLRCV